MSERVTSWNDDLDRGEQKMKEDITGIEGQMKAGFAAVDKRFERVDARFDKVDKRLDKIDEKFERLYHLLFGSAVSIVVVLIAALAAALAT